MSETSEEMYVTGLSFKVHSISVTIVWRTGMVKNDLPNTFFRACFVRPINPSQKATIPWCSFGNKLPRQETPRYSSGSFRDCDWNNCVSSSAAARYVDVLSEIIVLGVDHQLLNLWKANINLPQLDL